MLFHGKLSRVINLIPDYFLTVVLIASLMKHVTFQTLINDICI